jgi:hypothetical protein
MMRVVANALSPGFTTEDVEQRQKICEIMPDMLPKTTKPASRKKGADK